jgi:polygalacturonase
MRVHLGIPALALTLIAFAAHAATFNVKDYGAAGDGKTLDSPAINKAIEAASAAGGGTVIVPAGTYLSGSIRLKSHITLQLDSGSVIEASSDGPAFDPPEPNESTKFQDFGHSHWHNSLIWGESLEDIAITGSGLLHGKGLTRGERQQGGNKTIALKLCRNVTLRDFSILNGGHFGVLATGVENLTIDNLRIDTNRDGLDIDSCRNVRISNCSVNSPNDDAIVLKTSHGLGFAKPTENVTITNCLVAGYDIGSLLDGTNKRTLTRAPDRDGPTGRIKLGTESEGDFRNITISNIVFDRSRGLALESVDGSRIEDVAVSNLTMRDVSNAPIFLRLGARMRAPEGTPVGAIRRVSITNVVVSDADPRYGSILSGIPGHEIEDVKLSHITIHYRGGLTLDDAAKQPANLVNTFFFRAQGGIPPREPYATPEREKEYPEPSMFGLLPAYGFFLRHAKGIEMDHIKLTFARDDTRPAFVLEDVTGIELDHVQAQKAAGAVSMRLKDVRGLVTRDSSVAPDGRLDQLEPREWK